MKKSLRKIVRKSLAMLPKNFRHQLLRRSIKLPQDRIEGLVVKIAHRTEELEQAFSLLHDAYVAAGFMIPNAENLRVTKYHALPSTTTIIATIGSEVVGTVSLIRDGLFGFPSDTLFDKSELKKNGARIVEISSLAIHKDYRRRSQGQILWPLLTHLYRYSQEYFGADSFVIAVHPTHFEFYEAVLFFESLTETTVKSYSFVNNNPAVCGVVKLRTFYEKLIAYYGNQDDQGNLYEYLCKTSHKFLVYPKRENFKISDPFLTPTLLNYFFRIRTDGFTKFSNKEIAILHSIYTKEEYQNVLPSLKNHDISSILEKRAVRFDVKCRGKCVITPTRQIDMQIQNVSYSGFFAILDGDIRFEEQIIAHIALGDFKISSVTCIPMWRDQKHYGFKILEADAEWTQFINSLTRDLDQQHSAPPFSLISENKLIS